MEPLGVGIVGYGRIGAEHCGWINSTGGAAQVVAVADPTAARRALAESRGLASVDRIEALLSDPRIDAILVATPTSMHFHHASAALAANKHVMIEKPMAMDFTESRKLIDLAENRRRVISVFHNRRWDSDYLRVRAVLGAGILGRLINIESRLGQYASCVGPAAVDYRPGWRNEAAFGGGGLFDWGSHFVDQLWRLLIPARPVCIMAQLAGNVWSGDCDDFARILVSFDNGVSGLVEINTTTAAPLPRWHLDGVAGSITAPHSPAFDLDVWADLRFTPAPGQPDRAIPPTEARARLSEAQIWTRFAGACRGEGAPAVRARGVLATMAILDAARRSAREHVAVAIDWETDWEDR